MAKVSMKSIIQTSIVTALTVAAGLIWRDVIMDIINIVFPPRNQIFYKFLAAVIATVFVIISIYVLMETESEAERVIKKFKHNAKLAKSRKP